MSKELFVSSTPHETKVAIVEDDQLAEIYFERENEYTLAGSIYKGKVTRVLPGMQSAFVDIGLERDAFLYVTDFLEEQEDQEEFERIITEAHDKAHTPRGSEAMPSSAPILPPAEPIPFREPEARTEGAADEGEERQEGNDRKGGRWRNRRRRGRGRGIPESKFAGGGERAESAPEQPEEQPREQARESHPEPPRQERPRESRPDRGRERFGPPAGYQPIILPGESISKYRNMQQPAAAVTTDRAET